MKQEILDALRETEGSFQNSEFSFQETKTPAVSDAGCADKPDGGDTSSVTALAGDAPCHLASRSFCWENLPPADFPSAKVLEGKALRADGASGADIRAHWEKLAAEAAGIEGFDLREALKDPAFVRLTAPGVGVSVEDAWYALHRRESMRRDEQAGRQRLAQAVAASSRRPKEGGGGASALIAADYRSLSRAEQLRVKKRIAEAASRGEKIYP